MRTQNLLGLSWSEQVGQVAGKVYRQNVVILWKIMGVAKGLKHNKGEKYKIILSRNTTIL